MEKRKGSGRKKGRKWTAVWSLWIFIMPKEKQKC